MPPSLAAHYCGSDLTVKSTGASTRWAARIRAALLGAVGRRQPLGEPVRRIDGLCEHGAKLGLLGAGKPTQHRVDQSRKPRRARIGFGMGDGEVDGRAVGHVKKQDLRRRDIEDVRKGRRVGRQRPIEPLREVSEPMVTRKRSAVVRMARTRRAVAHVERKVLRVAMLVVGQPVERRSARR